MLKNLKQKKYRHDSNMNDISNLHATNNDAESELANVSVATEPSSHTCITAAAATTSIPHVETFEQPFIDNSFISDDSSSFVDLKNSALYGRVEQALARVKSVTNSHSVDNIVGGVRSRTTKDSDSDNVCSDEHNGTDTNSVLDNQDYKLRSLNIQTIDDANMDFLQNIHSHENVHASTIRKGDVSVQNLISCSSAISRDDSYDANTSSQRHHLFNIETTDTLSSDNGKNAHSTFNNCIDDDFHDPNTEEQIHSEDEIVNDLPTGWLSSGSQSDVSSTFGSLIPQINLQDNSTDIETGNDDLNPTSAIQMNNDSIPASQSNSEPAIANDDTNIPDSGQQENQILSHANGSTSFVSTGTDDLSASTNQLQEQQHESDYDQHSGNESDFSIEQNRAKFQNFDPFAASNADSNTEYFEDNRVVNDGLRNLTSSCSDVFSDVTNTSIFGPVWKLAAAFAKNEEEKQDDEEYEREEKFLSIRARAPPRINVTNQSENIKKLNQRQQFHMQKQEKLGRSLLARTRSRADVDMVDGMYVAPTLFRAYEENDYTGYSTDDSHATPISRTSSNDIIITTKVARKRTKVVQLLLFGIIGVLGGFFGSIYAQSTCAFIVAKVNVGGDDNVFNLHFGMWKYSPIESVFKNYSFCNGYDDEYANESPTIIRVLTFLSLLTGSFSMTVLWVYLIFGLTTEGYWNVAVIMLFISGCLQGSSFYLFNGDLCSQNQCSFGPGAVVSLITTTIWFLLSYEMYYNAPSHALLPGIPQTPSNAPLMTLELPEIKHHIKTNMLPFRSNENVAAAPSLSKLRKVRLNKYRGNARVNSLDDGSYAPPSYS